MHDVNWAHSLPHVDSCEMPLHVWNEWQWQTKGKKKTQARSFDCIDSIPSKPYATAMCLCSTHRQRTTRARLCFCAANLLVLLWLDFLSALHSTFVHKTDMPTHISVVMSCEHVVSTALSKFFKQRLVVFFLLALSAENFFILISATLLHVCLTLFNPKTYCDISHYSDGCELHSTTLFSSSSLR